MGNAVASPSKGGSFDTEMILELVKSRTAGEVYSQVTEFKNHISAQYSKLSEVAELKKLITTLS